MADDAGSAAAELTADPPAGSTSQPNVRRALALSLVLLFVLAGVTCWLGVGAYRSHQAEQARSMLLSVGRQAALNLTTISHTDADAAVKRILESSTGAFHADFQQRVQPFVQIVKQTQAVSEGTIAEAGLESVSDDDAQVMVAVSVKTTSAGVPESPPRLWRMRINVQRSGDEAKITGVTFVT